MNEEPENPTPETEQNNLPVKNEVREMQCSETEEQITIPRHQLQNLLDRLKQHEESEDKIADCCFKALKVFGLVNPATGEIIEAIKTGEGIGGIIFGAIRENISISDFMFRPKVAEKEMAEKFGFFKDLMPIFEDYARRKQTRG